jgi:hypothetical protein
MVLEIYMNFINLIIILGFIVIAYLCYEKWRSNKLLEEKSIETYKHYIEKKNNRNKKTKLLRNTKSTPINKLQVLPNKHNCYLKINNKELDKMSIKEIEAYPITIELSKSALESKIKYAKDYINIKIESFDNIKKRIPVNHDGPNSLTFYF